MGVALETEAGRCCVEGMRCSVKVTHGRIGSHPPFDEGSDAGIIINGQYWAIMTHFKTINELVRTIFELIRMGPR